MTQKYNGWPTSGTPTDFGVRRVLHAKSTNSKLAFPHPTNQNLLCNPFAVDEMALVLVEAMCGVSRNNIC